jgi:hypothetical protein
MESIYNTINILIYKLSTCSLQHAIHNDDGVYPFRDQIYEKDENVFYDDKKEQITEQIKEINTYPGDSLPYPYKNIVQLDEEMDEYWDEYWNKPIQKTNTNSLMYNLINELP